MGVVLTCNSADMPETSCCVWENEPPLCLLGRNLPFWDRQWVYQTLPIQTLCQWPENWIGHDNPQVMQLVPVSWSLWTQPCTGFFFWTQLSSHLFSLTLPWKAFMHFQRIAQNDGRLICLSLYVRSHNWEVKGRKAILPIILSGTSHPCLIKKSC